nr:isoprenylcysteine carboxylmethyltransferase family protein [Limisalsivibrio acetivorans]
MNAILLIISLIAYSVIHSVLADPDIMKRVYNRWWYRAFYVFQSIVLLVFPLWFYMSMEGFDLFNPPIQIKAVLLLVWCGALVFGIYAAKSYDNMNFLGIEQAVKGIKGEYKPRTEPFTTRGALRYVRHPYYFCGLVLLWSRPLEFRDLLVNVVFSAYFITGAYNEERKLRKVYGKRYEEYAERVPMLLPNPFKGRN